MLPTSGKHAGLPQTPCGRPPRLPPNKMKANMERGGLVYAPSLLEAETGAMQENVVHREVLKLDAL